MRSTPSSISHKYASQQTPGNDPIAFEKYVGTLFAKRGYRVEDTRASADEGIDLIVRQGRRMAVVQCKRYQGSVDQPVVRDLYGVTLAPTATEAAVIDRDATDMPTPAPLQTRAAPIAPPHTGDGEMEALAVAANGAAVYAYNEGGYSRLWRVDLTTGERAKVAGLPEGQIGHISVKMDGTLVCDVQTPQRNLDIWLVETDGTARPLTQSDRAGLDSASFVSSQLIHFPTFDGLSIPAFYYLPQTPQPAGGYPCILYIHGGPTSQLRPDFDVRFQYFLSRGYAILGTNVRGSAGYGRAYAALDEIEKRPDSVTDLKHAVLWLHQRAEIDSNRVAVYGRSYGGYMVLAALTAYPELFAAGIDVVGIANWVSFMERTSPWRRAHREQEYGSLSHHKDVLERISPIHQAERITMPLLVIAGDNDPRVPLFESELIVEKVRGNGGTVEFLHYADEGHKISKLNNRIDSFTKMAAFLDKSLG